MKIVVAPDSFKESLSALEAAKTMEYALKKELPNAKIDTFPMADGGEGLLDALLYATDGRTIETNVSGPLGNKITTTYGVLGDDKTVVIEIAKVAGLTQVPLPKRNPLNTTTYGIGEIIVTALEDGYRELIVGLGGSATNDGGLGMLQALGALFLDEQNNVVPPFGASLHEIKQVDFSPMHPKLKESRITVACDVMNPLCGKKGATYVFAAQKGATLEQTKELDYAMSRYAEKVETHLGEAYQHKPGAGAAGGLGFACMLLGAKMQSGAELVGNTIGIKHALADADWIITGEGKSDEQTTYGKVPVYIAQLARERGVNAMLLSGSLEEGYEGLSEHFAGCFSIITRPMTLQEAIEQAKKLLFQQTRNVARLMK